jgi:exosortase/archaeosortase family protein
MQRFARHNEYFQRWLPLLILFAVYFFGRLFFQQLTLMKTAFIYPTGLIVESFYGAGNYTNKEWLFGFKGTQFILGESCSGTTFFSLLIAYICFRTLTHKTPLIWLAFAYPIAIFANAMRVLSSIYAHNGLATFNGLHLSSQLHVFTGAITFLCCFLVIAYFIEKPKGSFQYGH